MQNLVYVEKWFTSLNNITTDNFKPILQSGLNELFTQMIKPRIRPILQEAYKDIKYICNWIDNLIKVYQATFTENNYNQIMIHILESVINLWEKTVFVTKFTQYGALRFDKDLRSVTNYFSAKMQWPFRDKFTRLNQISTLLNLESLSEIYELLGKYY
ncbi:unnamed protein product [Rhizophagus irregularis]|nr:unnamed protein product [Rhizophagus irregularis]